MGQSKLKYTALKSRTNSWSVTKVNNVIKQKGRGNC